MTGGGLHWQGIASQSFAGNAGDLRSTCSLTFQRDDSSSTWKPHSYNALDLKPSLISRDLGQAAT
jgi:hypothetical protein